MPPCGAARVIAQRRAPESDQGHDTGTPKNHFAGFGVNGGGHGPLGAGVKGGGTGCGGFAGCGSCALGLII